MIKAETIKKVRKEMAALATVTAAFAILLVVYSWKMASGRIDVLVNDSVTVSNLQEITEILIHQVLPLTTLFHAVCALVIVRWFRFLKASLSPDTSPKQ